jgi:hypothetical protein
MLSFDILSFVKWLLNQIIRFIKIKVKYCNNDENFSEIVFLTFLINFKVKFYVLNLINQNNFFFINQNTKNVQSIKNIKSIKSTQIIQEWLKHCHN